MKTKSHLLAVLCVALVFVGAACSKNEKSVAAATEAAEVRHPLQGEIVDLQADQQSLVVKHEDIIGFMPAMTMVFKVDAVTFQSARKGQKIIGILVQRGDGFWLEEVKPATP